MQYIIYDILRKNIRGWFLFHLLLNFIVNSFIVPTLTKLSNDRIIRNEIQIGIMIQFGFIILSICIDRHNAYYLDRYKYGFRTKVHEELEEYIQTKYIGLNWNKIRALEKEEFERIKQKAKYPLMFFIDSLVQRIIHLFPFIGYILWLSMISPLSVCFYIVGIGVIIYYYRPPIKERDVFHNIWMRHYFLMENQFTDIIHLRGLQNKKEIIECLIKQEERSAIERMKELKYSNYFDLAFFFIFGINLGLFVLPITNAAIVITYIQYSYLVRNNISIFGELYKQYNECRKEYDNLNRVLNNCGKRKIVPQLDGFEKIIIKNLGYTYPKKDSNQIPFTIQTQTPIEMVRGQIIRLVGETGDGKSSFMDIVCAIIPYKEITHDIYYDGISNRYAFDSITTKRFYVEQFESINWKPCIYEIITGKHIDISENSIAINITSNIDEELVWQAIEMAQATDFLKRYNDKDEKKWIYTKNIDPSGGQRGRIRIARIIYNMLKETTSMVILDEVDTAFQGKMGVAIMTNIFAYCRKNQIICLVSAHSTEVKNMQYDAYIRFNKGLVCM